MPIGSYFTDEFKKNPENRIFFQSGKRSDDEIELYKIEQQKPYQRNEYIILKLFINYLDKKIDEEALIKEIASRMWDTFEVINPPTPTYFHPDSPMILSQEPQIFLKGTKFYMVIVATKKLLTVDSVTLSLSDAVERQQKLQESIREVAANDFQPTVDAIYMKVYLASSENLYNIHREETEDGERQLCALSVLRDNITGRMECTPIDTISVGHLFQHDDMIASAQHTAFTMQYETMKSHHFVTHETVWNTKGRVGCLDWLNYYETVVKARQLIGCDQYFEVLQTLKYRQPSVNHNFFMDEEVTVFTFVFTAESFGRGVGAFLSCVAWEGYSPYQTDLELLGEMQPQPYFTSPFWLNREWDAIFRYCRL